MTRIKICGITEITPALAAAAAGAEYLGLVFAPSRRMLLPEKAVEIVKAIRHLKAYPAVVGVFVNSPASEVNRVAETCRLDWVQLSGNESWGYCKDIRRPVIKVIHVSAQSTLPDIVEDIEKGYSLIPEDRLICLLDSQTGGAYGGTGKTFDWHLAKEVSARFPVIIAGGLTPENVGQLVAEVRPWGVDVSSGVETGGKKDIHKIRDFIKTVKSLNGE